MEFLIYLDVCCLNRPFDDQTQERVRLEAEAVRLILERCQNGEWRLLNSEVIDFELRKSSDITKLEQIKMWTASANTKISIMESVESRSAEIVKLGFKTFDALHVACAEAGNADILLTADDKMCRLGARQTNSLRVRIENPMRWLMEVNT
jgi:predicted nucleic acid-binding protein